LKKITHAAASYHHFTATAIRYFGMSGGRSKKFARGLPSAHCFALILDDLFTVS